MSDDNAKPEADKKPEKTSEIPDAALDKATGGVAIEEAERKRGVLDKTEY